MTEHTKEPWDLLEDGRASVSLVHVETSPDNPEGGGIPIFSVNKKKKANAARIVSCVNALAGLNPEAVKDVVEALETYVSMEYRRYIQEELETGVKRRLKNCSKSYQSARAALAKLKGEAK